MPGKYSFNFLSKDKKIPLLGEFLIISSITVIIFAIISGWFGWKDYVSRNEFVKLQLETEAERLEFALEETLEYTDYLLTQINSQIKGNYKNDKFIADLLQAFSFTNRQNKDVFSLSMFSWSNKDGQITVNSEAGILKETIDASNWPITTAIMQKPSKLQFSKPIESLGTEKEMVLPMALGVLDNNGNYIGAIIAGYKLDGLESKLFANLKTDAVNFALLDTNYNLVMNTLGPEQQEQLTQVIENLKNPETDLQQFGFLNETKFLGKDGLSYFVKLRKFPYTFVAIYDKKQSDIEIYEALLAYNFEVLMMGLVMIGFFVVLRKRIVNPVIDLSNAAEAIAQGQTNIEIPNHEAYEIGVLASKLNEIQKVKQELWKAQDQIKKANLLLDQKVKERTFELEKALQAKSEFLNNMSHEIRTPIHGVQGYSEVLVEDWDLMDDKERFDLASKMHKASERLLSLINSLLDLSRFASGKMHFEFAQENLIALTKNIMEEVEPLYINKKPLKLELITEPNLDPSIELDSERIKQVLRNLFANAIKFTASGTISATIKNSLINYEDKTSFPAIEVIVSDEGIGIPPEELEIIFHAFSQSSRTKTQAGGTGLGLSICYEIIDAHHGLIWAENKAVKGTNFRFIIPRNQPIKPIN